MYRLPIENKLALANNTFQKSPLVIRSEQKPIHLNTIALLFQS